jgi:hypothetical protein
MSWFLDALDLLKNPYARVRRRVIAEEGSPEIDHDELLFQRAMLAMPRGYEVDAIYEFRGDCDAARVWMENQLAQGTRFRYLPLIGRDCFTFAKEALQRAGVPVLLWQLYLHIGDGGVARELPGA